MGMYLLFYYLFLLNLGFNISLVNESCLTFSSLNLTLPNIFKANVVFILFMAMGMPPLFPFWLKVFIILNMKDMSMMILFFIIMPNLLLSLYLYLMPIKILFSNQNSKLNSASISKYNLQLILLILILDIFILLAPLYYTFLVNTFLMMLI